MSINMSAAIPDKQRKNNKFGNKYWDIDFELNPELTMSAYLNYREKSPILGELQISGKRINLTLHEINRMIETLQGAKHSAQQAYNLNLLKD